MSHQESDYAFHDFKRCLFIDARIHDTVISAAKCIFVQNNFPRAIRPCYHQPQCSPLKIPN